jgi:hypothetical protein
MYDDNDTPTWREGECFEEYLLKLMNQAALLRGVLGNEAVAKDETAMSPDAWTALEDVADEMQQRLAEFAHFLPKDIHRWDPTRGKIAPPVVDDDDDEHEKVQ